MDKVEFNAKLDALAQLPEVTPEQIQEIVIDFINHLQEIIKNDKIDAILQDIEERVESDKFGVLAFIANFIKIKRQG